MGWLALCPSHGDNVDNFQYHILFQEDVEYLGAKILAYNFGLSYIDISNNVLPGAYRNGEILKIFDSLRRAGYFNAATLQRLRDPDKHFLLQRSGNEWQLTEANYASTLLRPDVREFTYPNPFQAQTPMIRIEHRHRPEPYDSPKGIDLLLLDDKQPVKAETVRTFAQPLDLSKHLGLGVWIYGDGGGQRVNIRIESSPHLVSGFTDHIVNIDFTGWRYFALAEADNGMYPSKNGHVYEEYRQTVHFNSISKVTLQIEGDLTNLRFRTVRALPLTTTFLVDPALETNEAKITFKGKIRNGHYMEYMPGGRAVVYDAVGNEVNEMQPDIPSFSIPAGNTSLIFSNAADPASVRITLRTVL